MYTRKFVLAVAVVSCLGAAAWAGQHVYYGCSDLFKTCIVKVK